ncbi:MAG: GNAT family N-acetyltransferase [Chloroflexi bacterium]|nr:GNAT family N-acetyltransferase [Chloroflexota bacterium]
MHKMLFHLPARLETERLVLRPYQAGDGEVYYHLCQNNKKHLLPFEAGNPALAVNTLDDAEILVREYAADWAARNIFFMGAWEKATQALVAQVVVMVINWNLPEFAVGYFVDKDHQGKGFITEGVKAALRFSFECLKAQRVRLECNEINVRSSRVAERCGFVREGFLRQTHSHVRRADGSFSGDYLYGMLRAEYETLYGSLSAEA